MIMEWWTHALYALAIVVVALIGWRERKKASSYKTERSALARNNAAITDKYKAAFRQYAVVRNERDENRRLYIEAVRAHNDAHDAWLKVEQSRRAYKGHNKRLRSENQALKERVADLEGEG